MHCRVRCQSNASIACDSPVRRPVSRRILGRLERGDWTDRLLIIFALIVFLLVIVHILRRRLWIPGFSWLLGGFFDLAYNWFWAIWEMASGVEVVVDVDIRGDTAMSLAVTDAIINATANAIGEKVVNDASTAVVEHVASMTIAAAASLVQAASETLAEAANVAF